MQKMNRNIPWDIIIKRFKNEISLEEQAALDVWLADGKNMSVYNDLNSLWLSIVEEGTNYESNVDALWAKMELRMKKNEPKVIKLPQASFRWLSGVASILILTLLSLTGYMSVKTYKSNLAYTYSSLTGKSKVMLPDGSQVWLNTESTLEYSTSIWNQTRNVKLKGEAYFDVKKDPDRPFIVKSNGFDVKVHGTTFNVAARENDPNINVSLLSGSVVVGNGVVSKTIVPGETAVCSKSEGSILTEKNDVLFAAMWANESIHFERKSIKELSKYLSKWYGVKIILDPLIPESQAYTFSIRHEPLEEILRLMARTNPIQYSFDEKNIVKIMHK
jgi:transmembrane sensor